MPDETNGVAPGLGDGTGGGSAAVAAPSSAPSSPPSSPSLGASQGGSLTPQQPSGSTGPLAAGAQAAPGPGASDSPAPAPSPLRDLVSRSAPDLAQQFADDQALVAHLLQGRQQLQQLQPMAQLGQQIMPFWSEFQKWRQQPGTSSPAPPAQQKPWWSEFWNPPEYDPSWEQLLTRDAQGNVVAAPGAPPDLPLKYAQYKQYRTQQADKLMSNPFAFFEQPIKTLAQQIAAQEVQRHLSSHQDQQFAREVTTQNAAWLYERNPDGGVRVQQQFDPNTGQFVNQPVLSQSGQAFRGYVVEAHNLGLRDLRAQQQYAMKMLTADWAQAAGQQAQGQQQQNQAAKQTFLNGAGATHNPGYGGSQSPPNPNGSAPSQNQNLSLTDRLRRDIAQAGLRDTDFQAVR